MTTNQYICGAALRRSAAAGAGLNGIDYLEVDPNTDINDPVTLRVVFLNTKNLSGLGPDNFRISGGVRYTDPAIDPAPPPPPPLPIVSPETILITLRAPLLTDYSTYTLQLIAPPSLDPPAGFDPQLASVDFSFKINCPAPFDCAPTGDRPPPNPATEPDLDYRARDWASLRRMMLDRLSALLPDFREDTPVDFLVDQVEALAYAADHLSYKLDAVATEQNLWTARSRVSLARHARLLDYPVHQGSNARCFVRFDYVGAGVPLPGSTPLLPRIPGRPRVLPPDALAAAVPTQPVVFETMLPITLAQGNNTIDFHTWSDSLCVLPRGATSATLRSQVDVDQPTAELSAGDFLLLAEVINPQTGRAVDADRAHRHVVRLVTVTPATDPVGSVAVLQVRWDTVDALPFDLTITAAVPQPDGSPHRRVCARAAGNIAPADHGVTLPPVGVSPSAAAATRPQLQPAVAPESDAWRPGLTRRDLVWAAPSDLSPEAAMPAVEVVRNDPSTALPAITLRDSFSTWNPRQSLLASERFDRDVVVETEHDGEVRLRFGDNVMGLAPAPFSSFVVSGRFGWPLDGKIGADALWHVVTTVPGIQAVTNPLPAVGGVPPLSPTVIRIEAPQAFRIQQRAVTEADWADVAQRRTDVARAVARIRWTGSWRTAFVYIDRKNGLPVERDAAFRAGMLEHLERYRLAGTDLAVRGPVVVPLDVALKLCVRPGHLRAEVRRAVLDRLGSGVGLDGRPGFFHPDNFTFGSPLYLSVLVAAVMGVPGVASVEPVRFRRFARTGVNEIESGVVHAGEIEILQMDNDPNFPENGQLELDLVGGS